MASAVRDRRRSALGGAVMFRDGWFTYCEYLDNLSAIAIIAAMEPPATPRTKKASRDLPGFADALQRSMRARGYTQTMLAEDLGVTQSMVSTWVNDIYAPNPALIATIEQTLNQRAGTLTRFFGFVPSHDDTDNVGVIYAIRADPDLSEAQADALVALYEHFAGTP